MVTAAAATCPDCRGGGEINGLPCACQQKPRKRPERGRVGRVWRAGSLGVAGAAGTLVRWSRSVPGVAGAAAVTIGAAMIAHALWPRVPLLAVALVVGGAFSLLIDRNL